MISRINIRIRLPHVLLFVAFMLLATACGVRGSSWAGISASENGEIYVSFDRFIAKLDSSGERLWTYPEDEDRSVTFFANVTITDGVVYVGDYAGGVHAVNSETGESIWTYKQSGTKLFGIANFGGSPDRIIGGVELGMYKGEDVLFVPDEAGIFIINRETGKRQSGVILDTDRAVWSQPIYVEGDVNRLFVTSLDHHIYALNLDTGEVLWKRDLDSAIPGSPVYDADLDTLFVGTFGSEVIAINAENGEVIDRFGTDGWVWGSPAWVDGTLYFSDLKGSLYAVSYGDGAFTQLWKSQLTSESKLRATPLVTDDLVIIGSELGSIYAVKRDTGEREWEEKLEKEAVSPLLIVTNSDEPLIVTATNDAEKLVVALQLDSGNESWSYEHKD